jgi:antitoxin component YwqK of YwqJK toxin-antitoxin module
MKRDTLNLDKMLKNPLLLCLISLSLTVTAQDKVIDFDNNDYKHTINFMDHKIVFQIKPSQIPRTSDPIKKYHWYSNNQLHVTQGGFSGKLLNGSYSDFYLSNNLKEKGVFKAGLKASEWSSWTANGILTGKVNYKQGILSGGFFKYDEAGNLIQEGTYRKGKMNGMVKTYHGADSLSLQKYKNGVLVSSSKPWFKRIFINQHQ